MPRKLGGDKRLQHSQDYPSRFGYTDAVSSRRIAGIRFVVYSNDHQPRHVHGFFEEAEVIADLLLNGDVALAERRDAIRPANAKRSSVKKILKVSAENFEELVGLWEHIHGKA